MKGSSGSLPRAPRRRTLLLIIAMVALGPLSTDLYLPSLPALREIFATDVERAQLTLSVFVAGFAIAQLAYGPLSDRYGRRPVLLGGIALFAAASVACTLATTIGQLVAARLLQAIGACAGPVLGRAIVRDLYGREAAARALAYVGAAMTLAPAVGPTLGGYLHAWFGWRASFAALAAFGTALLAAVALLLGETNRHRNPEATRPARLAANYRRLLAHGRWRGYALCIAASFAGLFSFISGSPYVLIGILGVEPQHFGLCFLAMVGGYLAGSLAAGRWTSRIGLDRMIGAGGAIAAAAGTLVAGFALAGNLGIATLLAPMFAYALAAGLVLPNAQAGGIGPFPEMAGAASALLGFVQMSVAALAGYAVAAFHDGTAVPMTVAIAAAGWATLAAWALLLRGDEPA